MTECTTCSYVKESMEYEIEKYRNTLESISKLAQELRGILTTKITAEETDIERRLKTYCESIPFHATSLCWARRAMETTEKCRH